MARGMARGFGPHGGRAARAATRARALVRAEDLVAEVQATFTEGYRPGFVEEGWRDAGEDGFAHPELGRVRAGGFYPYGHLYIRGWFAHPRTDPGVEGPLYPLGPFPTPEDAARLLATRRREVQYGSSVMYAGYRWEKAEPIVWHLADGKRETHAHHLRRWVLPGGGEVAEWGGRFIARRPGMPWLGPIHGAAAVEYFLEDIADRVRVARWWRLDPSGDARGRDTHAVLSAPELLV